MVSREFTQDGHTTRVTITKQDSGWQLIEERDHQMIRDVTYLDWHRVERAMRVLQAAGAAGRPAS